MILHDHEGSYLLIRLGRLWLVVGLWKKRQQPSEIDRQILEMKC